MWEKYLSLEIVEISYSEHAKEKHTMYYYPIMDFSQGNRSPIVLSG